MFWKGGLFLVLKHFGIGMTPCLGFGILKCLQWGFEVASALILLEIVPLLGEDDVPAAPGNVPQQLLQKEDETVSSEEDGPAVVIPGHLQVHTPDCHHLSFGSFGAGIAANYSGSMSFHSPKINLAEAPSVTDTASVSQADSRFVCLGLHVSLSTLVSRPVSPFFFGLKTVWPSPLDCQLQYSTASTAWTTSSSNFSYLKFSLLLTARMICSLSSS